MGVTDARIVESMEMLAEHAGIFAEPAAATSLAAARLMLEKRLLGRSESAVCVVTGHGLKDMASLRRRQNREVLRL
jgi:threonine synthase